MIAKSTRWHPIDWAERIPVRKNANQVLQLMAKNCNLDGKGELTIAYFVSQLGNITREIIEEAISYLEARQIIFLFHSKHSEMVSFILRINIDPSYFYSVLK